MKKETLLYQNISGNSNLWDKLYQENGNVHLLYIVMLYHKIRIELTSPCITDSIFSADQLSASSHLIKFNAHSFLSKSVRSFLLIISLLHADFQTDLWQCGMSVNAVKSLYYHNKKLFRAIFTSNLQSSIRNHQYTRYAAPSYLIPIEYLYIFLVQRIVFYYVFIN